MSNLHPSCIELELRFGFDNSTVMRKCQAFCVSVCLSCHLDLASYWSIRWHLRGFSQNDSMLPFSENLLRGQFAKLSSNYGSPIHPPGKVVSTSFYLVYDFFMTSSWLLDNFFITCLWLAYDLFTTWSRLVCNFIMTYLWHVYDLFKTFSWLAYDFLKNCSGQVNCQFRTIALQQTRAFGFWIGRSWLQRKF